jgi:hypothetical protein
MESTKELELVSYYYYQSMHLRRIRAYTFHLDQEKVCT